MTKQKQEQDEGKGVKEPNGPRYCPKCRSEYQSWVKYCIDCGTELTDSLPDETEVIVENSPLVSTQEPELAVVCTVKGHLNAEVLKSHLESEGIPAAIQSENYCLGELQIIVPKECLEEAKLIITSKESGETDQSDVSCPQCGAVLANKSDICDKCGDKLPINEFAHRKIAGSNCPRCGIIMTNKDKHQKKNIFGGNKDYYVCPECGKRTAVPEY